MTSLLRHNSLPTLRRLLTQLSFLLLALYSSFAESQLQARPPCRPIFVRWPRVRLNSNHVSARSASLPLNACRDACADERGADNMLQCSAFNHRAGINSYGDECQLFRQEHVQHTDGYVEADDRYTFYWNYCVDTEKSCTGEYAFTFLSDRYILASEVSRTKFTRSLEDCLAECLNGGGGAMLCRSVSFNRTDGGCHLSEQNQLSKPSAIRVNNNPNFRIDYYENNCYNNSFSFTSTCEPGGIRVRVDSRIPYTGALYGLYDFFSCRIEPKESKLFDFLFPYPHISKNCSDSIRIMGQEALLEVVLSTDGVEPLYFITADDLTYQTKCPLPEHSSSSSSLSTKWQYHTVGGDDSGDVPKKGASVRTILEALTAAAEQPSIRRRFELGDEDDGHETTKTMTATMETSPSSSPSRTEEETRTEKTLFTKDLFTLLPLFTLEQVAATSSSSTTTAETTKTTTNAPSSSETTKGEAQTATAIIALQQSNAKMDLAVVKGRKIGMEPIFDNSAVEGGPTTKNTVGKVGRHYEDEDKQTTAVTFFPTSTSSTTTSPTTTITTTINAKTEPTSSSSTTTTTSGTTTTTSAASGSSAEVAATSSAERVKATTKRAVEMDAWAQRSPSSSGQEFSFSTHLAFPPDQIWMSTGGNRATPGQDHEETTITSSPASTTRSSTSTTTTTTPTTTTTSSSSTSTTTIPTTTTTTTATTTSAATPSAAPPSSLAAARQTEGTTAAAQFSSAEQQNTLRNNEFGGHPPGDGPRRPPQQQDKVIFDIFHNGQPTEAVVVGSRITLAFTPYFAIPPSYMSISGCQVEPIGSLYDWEKEPLAIIKDGCQADHVGLVCPPQKTDYGIRVTVESFRYQTTTQIQYTCLVRICPFAPCPQNTCPPVDGCPGDDIVSRTLGLSSRARRGTADGTSAPAELTLEQIRAALIANPQLQRQLGGLLSQQSSLGAGGANPPGDDPPQQPHAHQQMSQSPHRRLPDAPVVSAAPTLRMNTALQQQLIVLGGDTIVRRRLVVVNSEEELRYYVKTGEVPRPAGA
ncbi:hypothetical protein niasHT_023777 [Heterodera trifolii]|uniref:ZP domain-containing protein n=1 Tax=Heterodera trifolii TaxID=157864 RepID=A0ABD2JNP0_9BILA